MLLRAALTVAFAVGSVPAIAANCNPTDVQTNIISCKNACNSSGHQPECNGSGTMDIAARGKDGAGVIRGFEVCHPDRMGNDQTKDEVAEACYNANHQSVVDWACAIYGHCPPPPPPPPTVKNTDYNVKMRTASDNKQILIAEFDVAGSGLFQGITFGYQKDNRPFLLMNTYAVGATFDNKFHIKITAYDYTIPDTTGHTYYAEGTVSILTPPN